MGHRGPGSILSCTEPSRLSTRSGTEQRLRKSLLTDCMMYGVNELSSVWKVPDARATVLKPYCMKPEWASTVVTNTGKTPRDDFEITGKSLGSTPHGHCGLIRNCC